MNEKLERRIEKLPRWAQRYISKLQRDNATLRAERGKVADGDAKVKFWIEYGESHGIPDRATVVFQADGGAIEFKLHDSNVRVHAMDTLMIKPTASNAIILSVLRR